MARVWSDITLGMAQFFSDTGLVYSQKKLLVITGISLVLLFLLHIHLGGILFIFPGYYEQLVSELHVYNDLWAFGYDLLLAFVQVGMSAIVCSMFLRDKNNKQYSVMVIVKDLWDKRIALFSLTVLVTFATFFCWEVVPTSWVMLLYFVKPLFLLVYYILLSFIVEKHLSLMSAIQATTGCLVQKIWHQIGWLGGLIMTLYVLPYLLPIIGLSLSFLHFSWLLYFGTIGMTLINIVIILVSPILYVIYAHKSCHKSID